ncbi:MAG: hypothetical protein K6A92_08250 [Lachnospiraceae bacterium]|nr:hypothetical protein [Lachnospiraceae bacterium]
MAGENQTERTPEERKAEKQRLKQEKLDLKKKQKEQQKEAKKRAKEIAAQEDNLVDEEEKAGLSVAVVTVIIIVIWLAILALMIKLDVGNFGSSVLAPILKDVPGLNLILPDSAVTETGDGTAYGGYSSLKEAVAQIESLEKQLATAQAKIQGDETTISDLQAEVDRLRTFESMQTEFERIKTEFYTEVVYAENGPGAEAYQKYYEAMDPTTAQYLYKQVVIEEAADQELQNYAAAYADMKPKAAAAIFEDMTDNLDLVAKILGIMSSDDRGEILGVMDPVVAARLTKIMDPDS